MSRKKTGNQDGERGNPRYDVAVVGGGAAGLAAAIRVRFVKEFEALPLSVALFEPSTPGGLLNAGVRRFLTGPSHNVDTSTLLDGLLRDAEKLEIPVIRHRVTSIAREAERGFLIRFGDTGTAYASSVVVATGSRLLGNELDFFSNGVFVTYKGLSFLSDMVDRAVRHAGDRPLAVATNRNACSLLPLFAKHECDYLFLVPAGQEEEPARLPGRVVGCEEWRIAGRKGDGMFALEAATPGEGMLELRAGAILLDYVSFQNSPVMPGFEFELEEERPGVPRVDAHLQASEPGLFFAGDVTCRYASVTSALADGITAGFGAYAHAYTRIFGHSPPLFAYRAGEMPERFFDSELPVLRQRFSLDWLQAPPVGHPMAGCDGVTLEEASDRTGLPLERIYALVYQAIRDKMVTVRPG